MFGLNLKFALIGAAAAFALGFAAGATTIWKAWNVAVLEANNLKMREDLNRTRQVLDLGKKIDDNTAVLDSENDEIMAALEKKLRDNAERSAAEAVENERKKNEAASRLPNDNERTIVNVPVSPANPPICPACVCPRNDSNPVCVDADSMRDIGKLR